MYLNFKRRSFLISLLDKTEGNIIGLEISGKVSGNDMEKGRPIIENTIKEYGNVRILLRLKNFYYSNPLSFIQDMKFISDNKSKIEKMAIVADNKIIEVFSSISSLFINNQKVFSAEKEDEAWEWVK
jgi:hypothetical protein